MRRFFFTDIFNQGPALTYSDARIGNIHRFMYADCQFEPCIFRAYESDDNFSIMVDANIPTINVEYIGPITLPAQTRIRWMLYLALPDKYASLEIQAQNFPLTRYGGTLQRAEDNSIYTVAARCINAYQDLPWSELYTKVMTRTRKELGIKEPIC